MKKLVSAMLAFCMILMCMTAVAPMADESNIAVSAATVSGSVGDTVQIPFTVDGTIGFVALKFALEYDETGLEWTGGSFDPDWSVCFDNSSVDVEYESGANVIIATTSEDVTVDDQVLYTASFKILSDDHAKYRITLNVKSVMNKAGTDFSESAVTKDGYVLLDDSILLSAGTVSGQTGDEVEVPITVDSKIPFAGLKFSISYDDTKLQWIDGSFPTVSGWSTCYDNGVLSQPYASGSNVILATVAATDVTIDNTVIYKAKFKLVEPDQGDNAITVALCECLDYEHNDLTVVANVEGGKITVADNINISAEDVSGSVGNEVEIPITIDSRCPFAALSFKLEYDETALAWVGGTFPNKDGSWNACYDNGSVFAAYKSGSSVIIGTTANTDQTSSGVMYIAKFKIKGDSSSYDIDVVAKEAITLDHTDLKARIVATGATVSVSGATPAGEEIKADDQGNIEVPADTPVVEITDTKINSITIDPENAPKTFIFNKDVTEFGANLLTDWSGDAIILSPDVVFNEKAFGFDSEGKITKEVNIMGWAGSTAQTYVDGLDSEKVTFTGLEEFKGAGIQPGAEGNENAFRYVARMRYAEFYQSANISLTAAGLLGGDPVNKSRTVPITSVFKRLDDAFGGEKIVADGYFMAALNLINLPTLTGEDYIDFTFTPDVKNPVGTEVSFTPITVRYSLVNGEPAFTQVVD